MTSRAEPGGPALDPVCGMKVDPSSSPHRFKHQGETFHFCCDGCRSRFAAEPGRYLEAPPKPCCHSSKPAPVAAAGRESAPHICPMCPEVRSEGGVFLIPRELGQSTVVMAQRGGISQEESPEYFASRIGNSILGGSGFTSRILTRVRTEKGYAYSASSLWTTPDRYEGIVGAVTQTKSESTIAATQLILEIMEEENLSENARKVGPVILGRLRQTQEKCKYLGDVRGRGLVMGMELVKDKKEWMSVNRLLSRLWNPLSTSD